MQIMYGQIFNENFMVLENINSVFRSMDLTTLHKKITSNF